MGIVRLRGKIPNYSQCTEYGILDFLVDVFAARVKYEATMNPYPTVFLYVTMLETRGKGLVADWVTRTPGQSPHDFRERLWRTLCTVRVSFDLCVQP